VTCFLFYCSEEGNNFHHLLQWLCYKKMATVATFAFFWWFCCEEGDSSNVITFFCGGVAMKKVTITMPSPSFMVVLLQRSFLKVMRKK
jgi:hypothetical protein